MTTVLTVGSIAMLPPKSPGSSDQRKLIRLFRKLAAAERAHLLSYAEFLLERGAETSVPAARQRPLDIPRPETETVVAAMRRLSRTFPMLNKDGLLHEASSLMSAHVMQGRPAAEVIDELELLFRTHHERMKSTE